MLTLLLQPSFHLNKSLTRLKNTFRETFRLRKKYRHSFARKVWQLHEYFYCRQSISMIPSVSAPTRILTLLLQPSFHLKKSSTTLKNTFRETAYRHSFERKIWQLHKYFFRRQSRSMIPSLSAPTRMLTLLLQPSFHLNKSLTRLKTVFVKLHTDTLLSAKFDNDLSTFFRRQPRPKIAPVPETTRIHTLLLSPSFHLNKSLTTLKNTFHETAYRHSFERKIWQWNEYFFRRQPRLKIPFVSVPNRMLTLLF